MRSFALPVALFSLAACAAPPRGSEDPGDEPGLPVPSSDTLDPDTQSAPTGELRAAGLFYSPSCDAPIVQYEAAAYRDGVEVFGFTCQWTFDDGATSDDCVGQHEFAVPGFHEYTLVMRSVTTDEVVSHTGQLYADPPLTIDLEVDVPACGLAFAWTSVISLPSFEYSFVTPELDVIGEFFFFSGSGAVEVARAGTYELTVAAEHERPAGEICSRMVTRSVTVEACDNGHEHTPTCPHLYR